ncbi:MAG: hypothetical protein GY862_02775 [Gammaproteobacteria bacterium]|nr:hypothetical protein [Gammaproteobacteria bacterium]
MAGIKGDFDVTRAISAYRQNEALHAETITAQINLGKYAAAWQALSAAAAQDVVLPDATSLPNGWTIKIIASGAATVTVKTFHATTPVELQSIASAEAFSFTLIDNSSDAGVWHVAVMQASDSTPSPRYTATFNTTTNWGTASGGYYTMTIAAASHGRGTNPGIQLGRESGTDFIDFGVDEIKKAANGDISIRVTETPDGRCAGRAVVM